MAWSTRQLADLADTTVKTVRYYHRIGLLDEPARTSNGYKQYKPAHLVRLLQIKRMSNLGVSLAQIGAMGRAGAKPDEAIRILDAELADTIDRLRRIRAELAVILEHRAPLDTPPPFGPVADELGERGHALVTVLSQVFDEDALDDLCELISERDDYEDDFEALPEDADDATIDELAGRLAVAIRAHQDRFPWLSDPCSAAPRGKRFAEAVMGPAFAELFNRAQLKALARAHALNQEFRSAAGTASALGRPIRDVGRPLEDATEHR
ncbi:MerR family transcriptional regulator [Streptomyces malaysiensis]|uniref:MerR family transcriptional regulator n=1 Tax=Streptomyces malaysiensis TaxID=92644 RepID=UPI0036B2D8B2